MKKTIPQLIDAYYEGKMTSLNSIVGILRLLKPARKNTSNLDNLGPELESALRAFISGYSPDQRSTGELPTDEQIAIARDWICRKNES